MATATKKAPKAGKKQSSSALIREYAKAHRSATAKQIADHLGVKEALVYNVRAKMKKGKRKAKKGAVNQAEANNHAPAEMTPADACVTFVRAAGGFAEAKKMLMTAEAFSGLRIR